MSDLLSFLERCHVCPRACGVNRLAGEPGWCGVDDRLAVASSGLHFGEEPVLVGRGGSGTVFLAGCNLGCVYCQNAGISHPRPAAGRPFDTGAFARLALALQESGAENLNLVSPTHQAPQIFAALRRVRPSPLRLPVVYNCGGYESAAFLRELAGEVDIYMPDFKYGGAAEGERYSGVPDYPERCMEALREMHRQVGDLALDGRGVAARGLLVRHLVLPGGLAGSRRVIDFLADEISPRTFLNVMDQYHPAGRAAEWSELRRRATRAEVEEAVVYARSRGMSRVMG